ALQAELRTGAIEVQPAGGHGEASHINKVGVIEELMESRGNGQSTSQVVFKTKCPLIKVNFYATFFEFGEMLFVFFPGVNHGANTVGHLVYPFVEGLFNVIEFTRLQIKTFVCGWVSMGADSVEFAPAVSEHPVGPVAFGADFHFRLTG